MTSLTDRPEKGRAAPWAVSDAPDDFIRGQLKAIVGFELTIARLEGKRKMSRNRPAEDGVVAGPRDEGTGTPSAAVACIVAARNRRD